MKGISRWPDGRSFALTLSHDVDRVAKRWQFLYYPLRAIIRRRPDLVWRHVQSLGALLRGDDPYWNFERITSLEDDLGVRSTFFFLNEQGRARWSDPRSMVLFRGRYAIESERIRRTIRQLSAGGWEIGVHGSYRSYRNETLLNREKEQLEHILGEAVLGIRQHYLNLDIPETWQIQARVGFVYDSSLGFSDRVGFRWGVCRPFYPKDPLGGDEIPILELPMAIMDTTLMQTGDPWQKALSFIDLAERRQGVLTINWHQRVFNPWEYREWQDVYVRIIQECQRRGAWVLPLGQVAEWWQAQAAHTSYD